MKSLIATCFLSFVSFVAFAQDPQFTQINNIPLYLNPANVGADQSSKLQLNHRGQWLGLPSSYLTSAFSGDTYFEQRSGGKQRFFRNTGMGVIALSDYSGGTNLSNTYFATSIATEARINPVLSLRSGIQIGVGNRSFTSKNLVFGDMLTPNGASGLPTQETEVGTNSIFYPDLGWGALLYSPRWSLGVSFQHINQPNYSIAAQNAKLPIKFTTNLSVIISLDPVEKTNESPKQYIKPTIMYRSQGKYDQLDLGGTIYLQPMVFGIWYRGLLLKKEGSKWNNQDAFSLYLGSKWEKLEFGVSYDVTISSLGSSTAGSYELSLCYLFGKSKTINGFTLGGAKGVDCESFPGGTGMKRYINILRGKKNKR